MLERGPVQPREGERLLPGRLVAGIDVDRARTSGATGRASFEVQAWTSNAAWLPSQHSVATRSATRWVFGLRSSRSSTPVSPSASASPARCPAGPSARSPGPPAPLGKRWRLSGRSARCGQHRRGDPGEVADQLALRDRLLVRALERREQDLVEVRELEVVAADRPDALLAELLERRRARLRCRPRPDGRARGAVWSSAPSGAADVCAQSGGPPSSRLLGRPPTLPAASHPPRRSSRPAPLTDARSSGRGPPRCP